MKAKGLHVWMLAVVGLLAFSACDKSGIEFENDFAASLRAWEVFKTESGDSYRYTVSGATWAGSAWQTHLTVKDGQVTGRQFEYTRFQDVPMPEGGWTLEAAGDLVQTLNSRGWGGGSGQPKDAEKLLAVLRWEGLGEDASLMAWPAETLDEVYARARVWLMKKKGATIYFETKNGGMISTCGFVPEGCMDDCFTGIHISSIGKLSD